METDDHSVLIGLSSIVVLGTAAQWLAWRFKLPSILILLLCGLAAGPLTGLLNPDALLGELLSPFISLSVAIILFEGGLSLELRRLAKHSLVVSRLITLGLIATWVGTTISAYVILGTNLEISFLIGAILIVTGPTVITPILRHARPRSDLQSALRWEGIVTDPIGAILAFLVFEAILAQNIALAPASIIFGIIESSVIGVLFGFAGAFFLIKFFQKFWIPDHLHGATTIATVFGVFVASNELHQEAGLLSVTLMGIILANQRIIAVQHLIEFKEHLQALLISALFIVLASRLRLSDLAVVANENLLFLAALVLIVRPAAVFISSAHSSFTWKDKLFLSFVAPRGIVAAAVASLFSLRLVSLGFHQAELIAPVVFFVIFGTALIYGLGARPLARRLGVTDLHSQGVLIIGAGAFAQMLAETLHSVGLRVIRNDWERNYIDRVYANDFITYQQSPLSSNFVDEIDLNGIGKILALSPNDEANTIASLRFISVFGRENVFQLRPHHHAAEKTKHASPPQPSGRFLFDADMTYERLDELCSKDGGSFMLIADCLSTKGEVEAFNAQIGEKVIPLFVINSEKTLSPVEADSQLRAAAGDNIIALVSKADHRKFDC